MILADKIINLRKKMGLSQEDLAQKMDVSRQSISKWESAKSIPDLNKIIMLSEIFGVSTDYLIKDEIEDDTEVHDDYDISLKKRTLKEVSSYIEDKKEYARLVSKGVLLIICSAAPLIFLLALSESNYFSSNVATASGLIFLLLTVALGVVFLVRANNYSYDFKDFEEEDFELEYGVKGIFSEKIKSYRPQYYRRIAISVALFITSPLPLITSAILVESDLIVLMMVVILLLLVGFGVYVIIPSSVLYEALNIIASEGSFIRLKRKENRISDKVAGFYWPLIVAIYLGWSFWTMDWGRTWIIWPVAGVAFAALIGFISIFTKKDDI